MGQRRYGQYPPATCTRAAACTLAPGTAAVHPVQASTILDPSPAQSQHPARVLGPAQPVDKDTKGKEANQCEIDSSTAISFCLRGVFPRCESCRPSLETQGIQMAMFRFIAAHPRRYLC